MTTTRPRAQAHALRPWITVQTIVGAGTAVAMIATMVFVAGEVIPPLVVLAALFALPLLLMRARPVMAAVIIGVVSCLQVLGSVFAADQVIANLTNPPSVAILLSTLAIQLVPLLGVTALIAIILRRRLVRT